MRERTDLDKKPTWYLFLASNVIVFIGVVVTFALFKKPDVADNIVLWVPTIVCNLVALALCAIFIWLEAKGIMNKAVHFQRKWLYWYLSALIVFVVAVIFSFVFLVVFKMNFFNMRSEKYSYEWKPLIADIVVTGVLSLVSIGLQRYARYKIDLDIYKRNRGELPKKEEMEKDKAKAEKAEAKSDAKASSGLADSISKE